MAFTRISTQEGFVCQNDIFNTCSDYEVTWCCPKWGDGNLHCDIKGFEWTPWLDKDDASTGTGDWETRWVTFLFKYALSCGEKCPVHV